MARGSLVRLMLPLVLACVSSVPEMLAQAGRKPAPPVPPPTTAIAKRGEVRVPFRAGEVLTYDVSYSTYVTAGTVTLNAQSELREHDGKREYSVPPLTQDALSAIYVLRALPLQIGFRETIPVTTGGRTYRAQISTDASETVATPAGSFNAFRLRTTLTEDGHTSGRPIVVWISDTPSRVPVKLQSELRVGSFVLALNQAKLGQ